MRATGSKEIILVLAVAYGIISGDGLLAQLADILPSSSLLWNLYPHVCRIRKPRMSLKTLLRIPRFKDIFKTALNFLVILFIFLIGFGLGFHILFINHVSLH